MSLRDRIQDDLTAARRAGDAVRRDLLGMVHSALYNAEKAKLEPLDEDEVESVLARELTMRREAIEAYRKGGREDLAAKEANELGILEEYMPPLDDERLASLVQQAVRETGASSARDMRLVMDWLRPKTAGRADGKRVAAVVAQALAQADLAGHHGGGH